MRNISIRSTWVLLVLALISIMAIFLVEKTQQLTKQEFYEEKLAAAELNLKYQQYLKQKNFLNEISIDNINDPNGTRLIGTRYSEITSGRGSLPIKLSTTNPNFAALIIELLKESGVEKGDHVAVCATGSFPAINIAYLAASEVLGLKTTFISSVTSSSWGANDPNYTYLDMHNHLYQAGLVSFQVVGASIGANQDIGRTLTPSGREAAIIAIERNNIPLINGTSLRDNVLKRIEIIKDNENKFEKEISLFINIGGGVASLGSSDNHDNIPSGLVLDPKLNQFKDRTGVLFEMVALKGVPFINFLNINRIMDKYGLPKDPVPLPNPGEGELFEHLEYNLNLVIGLTLLLIVFITAIILYDNHQNKLGQNVIK
ncbi:poly-gamma-glutamate system protein [Luteibaculum oceani]|uniref:Poly-gamma-glutamate system protein n=1 Tax=Luteibaculum oceani TaxID=1294296 RepID=A0A5C6USA5_9FLAO|nr:poly-gamma-glutamate system protein [Luteibaculum oceani]TXC76117.1 poly-gamma-glutamate system protein [Luteibaculum oceani]